MSSAPFSELEEQDGDELACVGGGGQRDTHGRASASTGSLSVCGDLDSGTSSDRGVTDDLADAPDADRSGLTLDLRLVLEDTDSSVVRVRETDLVDAGHLHEVVLLTTVR